MKTFGRSSDHSADGGSRSGGDHGADGRGLGGLRDVGGGARGAGNGATDNGGSGSNGRDFETTTLGAALARGIISLIGGLLGYYLAQLMISRSLLSGPNNLLYLTIVGVLIGYLVSGRVASRFGRFWSKAVDRLRNLPPDAVLAAFAGATLGLLVTVLLNNVMAAVPGFTWYWSQLIAVVLVVGLGGFFVANRKLIPFLRPPAQSDLVPRSVKRITDKVIDTSAIIDGRLTAIVESNFLEGHLILPHYVLTELQRIADSDDQLRRQRGRRGLEALDKLVESDKVTTEIAHQEHAKGPVDDRLVQLCLERGASLVTTDYNLSRVAQLQGVKVFNLHQLASSVKASYLPGERLSLVIVRQGREAGQGLAYLEDGTMVVVEGAGDSVGETLEVVVTSSLQTNMGRMIFAKPEV